MVGLVASCDSVLLCFFLKQWYIYDGKEWHEMTKNDAHLIFNDYLGQVMSGCEAEVNLELRGR